MRTLGEIARQPAPRSFWRQRLALRASPTSVEDYLVDEANLRGFWGAYRREPSSRGIDGLLRLEEIVVGLMAPQAPAEPRHLKLVLRILQSDAVEARRLWLLAKREKAEDTLRWLLQNLPVEERTPRTEALMQQAPRPRAPRPPRLDYDFRRLIRRPATAKELWKRARRES
ncbi:MAG: hypothetical protein HYZ28_01070 [Myxococcales bacterium]|nr:hypothetical protein [Myxococcales bacterium]